MCGVAETMVVVVDAINETELRLSLPLLPVLMLNHLPRGFQQPICHNTDRQSREVLMWSLIRG